MKKKTCRKSCQITGFNYYHYFVQPDQRIYNISILHTYNCKSDQTNSTRDIMLTMTMILSPDLPTNQPIFVMTRVFFHHYCINKHHYYNIILTTLCTKPNQNFLYHSYELNKNVPYHTTTHWFFLVTVVLYHCHCILWKIVHRRFSNFEFYFLTSCHSSSIN